MLRMGASRCYLHAHLSIFFAMCTTCKSWHLHRESLSESKISDLHAKSRSTRKYEKINRDIIWYYGRRTMRLAILDVIIIVLIQHYVTRVILLARLLPAASIRNWKRYDPAYCGIRGMYVELKRMVGNGRTVSTGIRAKQEAAVVPCTRSTGTADRSSFRVITFPANNL